MSKQPKKKAIIKPIDIPPHLKDKVNNVKNRILFLSPSVLRNEERECRKDDFESLANSNIGVGGFGKVYKVRHKVSKNVFAIKVINKKKIMEHDLVEQIKLEVKIMYMLDHDHVLKLYNHYEDDDNFYLILQFCAKGQIYSLLKKEGRFNEKIAAQYLRECISAVKYLHSLDPPIIHRDIKPENILLDSNGVVKLADFGWSNYFDDDNRRLTYCGTPEYLAPEMIKQSGHDKALDVWNLGVLLFELLTGSPPFEGGSQNELFSNILALKIKWPKGFSGIAKDLISKLLKIDPKQRIPIGEICDHPWFKSIPQIRPVSDITLPSTSNKLSEMEIKPKEYQVVTNPSISNKIEQQQDQTVKRTSVLDKKLEEHKKRYGSDKKPMQPTPEVTTIDSARQQQDNSQAKELQLKLQKAKKENQDLKYEYQKKCNETEQKDKRIKELETMVKDLRQYASNQGSQSNGSSQNANDSYQVKQLTEEVNRLRSLNKTRDELHQQIDTKNQSLRETETRLKITQIDKEETENKLKTADSVRKELMEKNEDLERKVAQLKDQHYKLQKEKEQTQIQLENKIEILQYKLLNSGGAAQDQTANGTITGNENTFHELLQLCKGDLNEITSKLNHLVQNEQTEDNLRKEIIDQGRKMNELRQEHERQMYNSSSEQGQKMDNVQQRFDQDKKKLLARYKEEQGVYSQKIQSLERQLQKDKALREKAESSVRQIEEIKTTHSQALTDINILKQEKVILQKKVQHMEGEVNNLRDQLHANKFNK